MHTLTLSEQLYRELQTTAQDSGFESIEQFIQRLIEVWQVRMAEFNRRQVQVGQINALRERLFTKYGVMDDSVDLIRADRER